jgi:hypothetical protein
MTQNQKYWIAFTIALVLAYYGWSAPQYGMPLDYGAMTSRSVPSAIVWAAAVGFGLWRYRKRGLLFLVGTPMALYWPVWLLFNDFPQCHYLGNCV